YLNRRTYWRAGVELGRGTRTYGVRKQRRHLAVASQCNRVTGNGRCSVIQELHCPADCYIGCIHENDFRRPSCTICEMAHYNSAGRQRVRKRCHYLREHKKFSALIQACSQRNGTDRARCVKRERAGKTWRAER